MLELHGLDGRPLPEIEHGGQVYVVGRPSQVRPGRSIAGARSCLEETMPTRFALQAYKIHAAIPRTASQTSPADDGVLMVRGGTLPSSG